MLAQETLWLGFWGSLLVFLGGIASTVMLLRKPAGGQAVDEDRRRAQLLKQEARDQKRRDREIERVARDLHPQIIRALVGMKFAWTYERQGASMKMIKPKIRDCLYEDDAIYFRINSMPYGSKLTDLLEADVAKNMSLVIGRECRFIESTDIGVWLQVGLKSGLAAIPRFFPWKSDKTTENALEQLPKTKPWAVAMGVTNNRKLIYADARDWPHLLVAGATGGGKSVFLNQMLCSLLLRNSPSSLQLVLIDLKGGLEFWPYEGVPHLRRPVVFQRHEVPGALQEIIDEKERRFHLFRNAGVKDIKGWNATANRHNKLPRIFVLFDEIANLTLDNSLKGAVDALMGDVAAQGRALGIHLVLCTQVPNKSVLTRLVLSNVTARVGFNSDFAGSMLIMGNGRLAQIPPGGRMIYRQSNTVVECQAPMITEKQITETVGKIIAGEGQADEEILPETLFTKSILDLGGNFAADVMYDALGGDVAHGYIRDVAARYLYTPETQGPVLDVAGGKYILAAVGVGGGRRLLPVNGHLPATRKELRELAKNAILLDPANLTDPEED